MWLGMCSWDVDNDASFACHSKHPGLQTAPPGYSIVAVSMTAILVVQHYVLCWIDEAYIPTKTVIIDRLNGYCQYSRSRDWVLYSPLMVTFVDQLGVAAYSTAFDS